MNKKILSIILKSITFIASLIGVILCVVNVNQFMGGATVLLYFTIQSNIWIGITCFVALVIMLFEKILNKKITKHWMFVLKFVFTVSITLTGFVFCFVLAPTIKGAFSLVNILTHVIVPIASIADWFIYDCTFELKKYDFLYVAIPGIYYLIFITFGYFLNWDFGGGNNYPYFFMNWASEAGAFGFSKNIPWLGTFYWIILIVTFVLGVAILYQKISNKIYNKHKNQQ